LVDEVTKTVHLHHVCTQKEKDKDTVPPTISLPGSDTLIVDLGDKAAALLNVKANDDVNGDLTSSIILAANLETLGYTKLEYSVSDLASNKATAERPAIVSSKKLIGLYDVDATIVGVSGQDPYRVTAVQSNTTGIIIKNFNNHNWEIEFIPGEDGKMIIIDPGNITYSSKQCTLSGELRYGKVEGSGDTYRIISAIYTLTPKDGFSKVDNYDVKFIPIM
jgi:hypothetical protein